MKKYRAGVYIEFLVEAAGRRKARQAITKNKYLPYFEDRSPDVGFVTEYNIKSDPESLEIISLEEE